MDTLQLVIISTVFLISLVAGFLFAFSVIVMPGIKKLSDLNFLRAFKEMDQIIQNNHPIFIFVWAGSVISSLILIVTASANFGDSKNLYLIALPLFYLICTQVPTFLINIPLNNRLQSLDLEDLDDHSIKVFREDFERKWNRANIFRTVSATITSLSLIFVISI